MKTLVHGHDAAAFGLPPIRKILARQLDGRLVGLGPAVAEKDPVRKTVVHEPLGQLDLGPRVVEVGYVEQGFGLAAKGFHHPGVDVAQVADGDAGDKVDVGAAGHVRHPGALPCFQHQREAFVGGRQDLFGLLHQGLAMMKMHSMALPGNAHIVA